jgi:Flp pilus assembly secretin CpaC
MRLTALAALSCLALMAGGVEANAASLSVPLDRSVRLSVPGSAASVVIGNPDIADVTVVDSHNIFVSGRSFGSTDIHVLDADGRLLISADLVVSAPNSAHVSIYRGATRTDLSCSPVCQSAQGGGKAAAGVPSAGATAGALLGGMVGKAVGSAASAGPVGAAVATHLD